jgi:hypothetical protein
VAAAMISSDQISGINLSAVVTVTEFVGENAVAMLNLQKTIG